MTRVPLKWVAAGILVVTLVLAGVVSHYASSDPDGLARVAEDKGFASTEQDHAAGDGPFAGYAAHDVDNDRLSGALAGVVGVGVVLLLAGGLALAVRRRTPADAPGDTRPERDETPVG
jgi:cobalt/nickel transport protein